MSVALMNKNKYNGIEDTNLPNSAAVLVVDDHPAIGVGLSTYFEAVEEIEDVGYLPNADNLIDYVNLNHIDIVITQLGIDHAVGFKTIEKICHLEQQVKVIVYSQCEKEGCVANSIRIGASGYVSKRSDMGRILEAVRAVLKGGSYLDPALSAVLMDKLLNQNRKSSCLGQESLTEREIRVLNCVAEGQRNKEVARELMISERTVKYHVRSIFEKLGISSRTAMVKIALSENLITH